MAWWQVILVLLGSIAAGLAVGIGVFFVIARLTDRTKSAAVRREAAAWAASPLKTPAPPPAPITPTPAPIAHAPAPAARAPAPSTPAPAPVKPGPPPQPKPPQERTVESSPADLVAEVDANRRVASGAWNGKLQQFSTRAWDNRGDEVHELPPDVRDQLAEAYSDMSLANSIVWLATEMGRRSASLDDSYVKLRTSVGARLDQVRVRLGVASRPVSPPG